MAGQDRFEEISADLAEVGRMAHVRGWVPGTSGNFSAVVRETPLEIAITATGLDKGLLGVGSFLRIDGQGTPLGPGRPSAETSLHLAIARAAPAGAVLHTHSPWSTLLSDVHAPERGVALEGYELLKGLEGVKTHAHREWVPIIENTQDWAAEAPKIEALIRTGEAAHAFLIRRHGLYTWGPSIGAARRHLEIFELLLEVVGRRDSRVTS